MRIIKGKGTDITVYQDQVDEETLSQISLLADQAFTRDSNIRIMPDCHAGKGCVIGTTMTIKDKIVPNLVGVDIGCGMLLVKLGKAPIDFSKLDRFIHEAIPSGMAVHEARQDCPIDLTKLRSFSSLKNPNRFEQALGTLGGGNHFIEVDQDEKGEHYLAIHSGSRNLGKQVAEYYQDIAIAEEKNKLFDRKEAIRSTVSRYKKEGRSKELEDALKELNKRVIRLPFPEELAYLEGQAFSDYLHDMDIAQRYAVLNREMMARKIVAFLGLSFDEQERLCTIHNYIDLEKMILRKGAISAQKGEKLIIPINMRDGTILGTGKGNADYNFSAPHGAGRLYSRSVARERFTLADFQNTMKGIYSTSVQIGTLDESPFAYKSLKMILPYLQETVEVDAVIKPVYNFKAVEGELPFWSKGMKGL